MLVPSTSISTRVPVLIHIAFSVTATTPAEETKETAKTLLLNCDAAKMRALAQAKKKQKELTDEQKQETQGCSMINGLRPQHATVLRPAGLVQVCEELRRGEEFTDMRPQCVEPKPAPFGVGTTICGAGCGVVNPNHTSDRTAERS